jgi:hypothetical protein
MMNYIRGLFHKYTKQSNTNTITPQVLVVPSSEYVMRIASWMNRIGWIIYENGKPISRGTSEINSHNDENLALCRAFYYGLDCAHRLNIRNITVETSTPNFMVKESNAITKRLFKASQKQLFQYITKNFVRIHYTTLPKDPEDVIAYIQEYSFDDGEEFKDERSSIH